MADQATGESYNRVNYVRRAIKQTDEDTEQAFANAINAEEVKKLKKEDPVDLCFEFQVSQIEDCQANSKDQLSNKVEMRT